MRTPPLDMAVAYNERTAETEDQAERLREEYVEGIVDALRRLGHRAYALEVSGAPAEVFRRVAEARPDLVFNLAEGQGGAWREAFCPMLYGFLGLPYTGAGPGILGLGLDKRLTEEALALRGVAVPRGALVTPEAPDIPDALRYPLLVKPNFEGSSMGIHQGSVVQDTATARRRIDDMLEAYPDGLDVEEFIEGREITVGYVEGLRERFTAPVEYRFPEGREPIMDYETKMAKGAEAAVTTFCPAPLGTREREAVLDTAARAVSAMRLPDLGRVDLRLRADGRVFLIEVNPLPGLRRISPLVVGARAQGHGYDDVIGAIVGTAARRHGLTDGSGPSGPATEAARPLGLAEAHSR